MSIDSIIVKVGIPLASVGLAASGLYSVWSGLRVMHWRSKQDNNLFHAFTSYYQTDEISVQRHQYNLRTGLQIFQISMIALIGLLIFKAKG